jgi:flagellar hook-length control protein FliK
LDNIFAALLANNQAPAQRFTPGMFAKDIKGTPATSPSKPGGATIQPVKNGKTDKDTASTDPMAALASAMLAAVAQKTNAAPVSADADTAAPTEAVGKTGANGAQPNTPVPPVPATAPQTTLPQAANAQAANQPAAQPQTIADPDAIAAQPKDTKTADATATARTDDAKKVDTLLSALTGHTAPPAQVTEAKATPVRFDAATAAADKAATAISSDAKNKNASADSGNGDGKQDSQTSGTAQKPDAANVLAKANDTAPAQTAPVAPAAQVPAQPAQHIANTDAANAINSAQPAPPQSPTQPAIAVAVQAQSHAQADDATNLASLAVSIAVRSKDGAKQFDIRLDPAELGRVDVRLSMDDTGRAQAHLSADKPQTLDLLQRDRPALERSLKDAGVDLTNNGLSFSLKGQERQGDGGTPGWSGRAFSMKAIEGDGTPATAPIFHHNGGADARLDIRV